jgi:hypothetical protein
MGEISLSGRTVARMTSNGTTTIERTWEPPRPKIILLPEEMAVLVRVWLAENDWFEYDRPNKTAPAQPETVEAACPSHCSLPDTGDIALCPCQPGECVVCDALRPAQQAAPAAPPSVGKPRCETCPHEKHDGRICFEWVAGYGSPEGVGISRACGCLASLVTRKAEEGAPDHSVCGATWCKYQHRDCPKLESREPPQVEAFDARKAAHELAWKYGVCTASIKERDALHGNMCPALQAALRRAHEAAWSEAVALATKWIAEHDPPLESDAYDLADELREALRTRRGTR